MTSKSKIKMRMSVVKPYRFLQHRTTSEIGNPWLMEKFLYARFHPEMVLLPNPPTEVGTSPRQTAGFLVACLCRHGRQATYSSTSPRKRSASVRGKMDNRNLSVLMITPEAAPFARSGGLGDVAGALPAALQSLGLQTSVILPYYRCIRKSGIEAPVVARGLSIPLGSGTLEALVRKTVTPDGVEVYFLEREDLYDRPNLYNSAAGDYYDNLERFCFFCHGALKAAVELDLHPDVIHCHDWQASPAAPLLAGPYRNNPGLNKSRCVFTIHNIGYQGTFPADRFPVTGLSKKTFFHIEGLEYWGGVNLMKGGILYSDIVTTVSPSYALEIQTPQFGMGLEGVLQRRSDSLTGILNGVDYRTWNPAVDPLIPANYSDSDIDGKIECKRRLMASIGLESSLSRPVIGIVSRLDRQKGLDLVAEAAGSLIRLDTALVILGTGDREIQHRLERAAVELPGRMSFTVGFDDELAHRIIAGSDILLVPSLYEPCGLTQIYAMKYGTVPVVRAVGGLEDTIMDVADFPGRGNGFKFKQHNPLSLVNAVRRAVEVFEQPRKWRKIVAAGMALDFSWNKSAEQYLALYREITD
jgi:starch synthase